MRLSSSNAEFFLPRPCGTALLFSLLTAAVPSQAQPRNLLEDSTETIPEAENSEIIVTGSRIPRSNLVAVSPTTVIDGKEVKLQGAVLVEQLINSLPQTAPDQGSFISNGATGTSTVDLRGLGAGRTLVLVNGRRLLPGDPSYPAPDINAVPAVLIRRVEVLTGGASSVYGSDALAGVVNFILETDLEGLRIDGQVSAYQHDNRDGSGLKQALIRSNIPFPEGNTIDGEIGDFNGAFGTGFADSRGHLTVYAGYRRIAQVTEDSRDYSACSTQGRIDSNTFDCGGSIASETGTFFTNIRGDPMQVGSGREFIDGTTLFNFAPFNYYQRPGRRFTAGGFANFDVSRAVQPFLEVMYMDDRTTAQLAPSALFGGLDSINCDTPLLSDQQLSFVCTDGNLVGQERGPNPTTFTDPVTGATYYRGILLMLRRNVEGGPRRETLRHKNLRLLAATRGELGRGTSYEASLLLGRVDLESAGENDLSIAKMGRALDVIADPSSGQSACRSALTGEDPACVPWDIFAPGAVTSEATSYLSLALKRSGTVKQFVATAFANFDLAEWGIQSPWSEEGPSLNIGAELRKDRLEYRPDAALASGDVAGAEIDSPVNGSTEAKEWFGEVRLPLVSKHLIEVLAVEGGYRRSWQSNSESRFRSSSYKFALEFAPIADIRFRASVQRAVRAPNVQELFAPVFRGGFGRDACAGPNPAPTPAQCAMSGVRPEQYGLIAPTPLGIPYNAIAGGNPELKAEKARTKTLGVVLRPRFISGLSATVDWFDIEIDGMISQNGPTVILNTCIETGDPVFCDRVHRDANGSLWQSTEGYVDNRNVNIGKLTARGVDIGFNFSRPLGQSGSLELDFLGSWLKDQKTDRGGLATPQECAGAFGFACGVPKPSWRHKARATWTIDDRYSLSLQWRRFGSVTLDRSIEGNLNLAGPWRPGDKRIGPQNYFDLTALARLSATYEIRFGIQNLFDREPPMISTTGDFPEGACPETTCNGNTFPQLYDPLGRYIFAGVSVKLSR